MHVVGKAVQELRAGQRLFDGITAGAALAGLREILACVGIKKASSYRCHDIRRGHALDLQLAGALAIIDARTHEHVLRQRRAFT